MPTAADQFLATAPITPDRFLTLAAAALSRLRDLALAPPDIPAPAAALAIAAIAHLVGHALLLHHHLALAAQLTPQPFLARPFINLQLQEHSLAQAPEILKF